MSFEDFVNQLQEVQADYVEAKKVSWLCLANVCALGCKVASRQAALTIGQRSTAHHSLDPPSAAQLLPAPAPKPIPPRRAMWTA